MNQFIKLFLTTAGYFLILDMLWLLVISKKLYQTYLGDIMGQVRLAPAIIFYILYVLGMLVFVINPALAKESVIVTVTNSEYLRGRQEREDEIINLLINKLYHIDCCCDSAYFGDHYLSHKQPDNIIDLIRKNR